MPDRPTPDPQDPGTPPDYRGWLARFRRKIAEVEGKLKPLDEELRRLRAVEASLMALVGEGPPARSSRGESRAAAALRVLRTAGGPLRTAEIVRRLRAEGCGAGLKEEAFRSTISLALTRSEFARKVGRGTWEYATEPRR
jgi:hypothetical protein